MIIKIVLTILVVVALLIGGGAFYITRGLESGKKLNIGNVDLKLLKDGTYKGEYNGGRWSNEISVIIKDHKITGIDIIKDVKFPTDANKELFGKVIERQTPNVDVVSGATVTSKAYLKSIENALKR
jgi:uncharacterized protein with FMN-binding domain